MPKTKTKAAASVEVVRWEQTPCDCRLPVRINGELPGVGTIVTCTARPDCQRFYRVARHEVEEFTILGRGPVVKTRQVPVWTAYTPPAPAPDEESADDKLATVAAIVVGVLCALVTAGLLVTLLVGGYNVAMDHAEDVQRQRAELEEQWLTREQQQVSEAEWADFERQVRLDMERAMQENAAARAGE